MAGTAARSFAPWVSRVLAAMQPQPSGTRPAGSTDISVRVSTPQICRHMDPTAGSGCTNDARCPHGWAQAALRRLVKHSHSAKCDTALACV